MSKKHGKRTGSKRNRVPKGDVVWRQTAEEATLARKPYYNAFACGHGVHGDTKYNRAKEKRTWKRNLQKGASQGSFLLAMVCSRLQVGSKQRQCTIAVLLPPSQPQKKRAPQVSLRTLPSIAVALVRSGACPIP